ncbi:MAG: hypothetical protein HYW23_01520 [Candidatus Aenigmarchaeota archaeon]|nr:hypothetical protein [Candidatus Aenigmarchaeota archaeon]
MERKGNLQHWYLRDDGSSGFVLFPSDEKLKHPGGFVYLGLLRRTDAIDAAYKSWGRVCPRLSEHDAQKIAYAGND